MISQAGGMALKGLLPVVHPFACFLSARPNEQIYNNSTELTKLIYVGSLAGILPGEPGHSHQAVRDISALAGVPGLMLFAPSTEVEVTKVFDWCVNHHNGSSYIRLESLSWPIPFSIKSEFPLKVGRGFALTDGLDAVLVTYGPIMLSEAYLAAEELAKRGIGLKVINLPWLNKVDQDWLRSIASNMRAFFTLDDHYLYGGQGDMLHSALSIFGIAEGITKRKLGVKGIPKCGINEEVLQAHRLDSKSIANYIEATLLDS